LSSVGEDMAGGPFADGFQDFTGGTDAADPSVLVPLERDGVLVAGVQSDHGGVGSGSAVLVRLGRLTTRLRGRAYGKAAAVRCPHGQSARATKPSRTFSVSPSQSRFSWAEKEGFSAAVFDLRTIIPYDWAAISALVQKTNRVIVAHEDQLTCGFGAEIAARIADELFHHLDAPIRRVAALDCPVAYAPDLEEEILPQSADVLLAIRDVCRY